MAIDCEITFRKATPEDADFVLDLRTKTLRDLVVRTWGAWDEERQRRYVGQILASEGTRIVQIDSMDAGILDVEEHERVLHIETIGLLPAFHGRGIGSRLIRDTCTQAAERLFAVTLTVQRENRRATTLYERLGFIVTGETMTSLAMTWMPSGSTTKSGNASSS